MIDLDTLTPEEIKRINKLSDMFKFKYGFDGIESFKRAVSIVECSRDMKYFTNDVKNPIKPVLRIIKREVEHFIKTRDKSLQKVKMRHPSLNGECDGGSKL